MTNLFGRQLFDARARISIGPSPAEEGIGTGTCAIRAGERAEART
jgi:hypothetical protein